MVEYCMPMRCNVCIKYFNFNMAAGAYQLKFTNLLVGDVYDVWVVLDHTGNAIHVRRCETSSCYATRIPKFWIIGA